MNNMPNKISTQIGLITAVFSVVLLFAQSAQAGTPLPIHYQLPNQHPPVQQPREIAYQAPRYHYDYNYNNHYNQHTPIYPYNSAPTSYPVYYPVYTQAYSQPSYSYSQPSYTYTQPSYSYSQPSYSYPSYSYSSAIPTYTSSNYGYQTHTSTNINQLQINCYSDPVTSTLNQPVTWTAQVSGGIAPYRYAWTGSDGISGSQSSVIQYYNFSGDKNATVSVTSSDGLTSTHTCDNTLTVQVAGTSGVINQTNTQGQTTNTQQSATTTSGTNNAAAAVYATSGIPWGWIAFLIILILIAATVFLLFERRKV